MADINTVEYIINQIDDPAKRLVAQTALTQSRKAMDFSEHSRIGFVADETGKIIPRALRQRLTDAA
jgi:hypothetical protein